MNLSEHFTLAEMIQSQTAERFELDNTPGPDALAALNRTAQHLEYVRALVRAPIVISSGYRSPEVNRRVGGAANSQHLTGCAADITVAGLTPLELMRRIARSSVDYDQLILEFYNKATGTGWVHVSFAGHARKQALVIDKMGTRAWV